MDQPAQTSLAIIKVLHRVQDALPDAEELGASPEWLSFPASSHADSARNTGQNAGSAISDVEFSDLFSLRCVGQHGCC
jgi:hypothetical protein